MSLKMVSFKDGILTFIESGRIDANDAQVFERTVHEHANASLTPIVVLINALEVKMIMPEANRHFLRASTIPNVKAHIVATEGLMATQGSRILGMRNQQRNTLIFNTWEEAQSHAQEIAEQPATR